MSTHTPRIDWSTAEMVFVTLPTCPACGATGYHRIRTAANGDGSRTKRVVCRLCGETKAIIRDAAGLSGQVANQALGALLSAGDVVPCEVVKSNHRAPYQGYKLNA